MSFREQLKDKYPKTFAARDRGSPRAAVKLQCLECVGGIRADVASCTDRGCPLYVVRPYKTDGEQPVRVRTSVQMEADKRNGERLKASRRTQCPDGVGALESTETSGEGLGRGKR